MSPVSLYNLLFALIRTGDSELEIMKEIKIYMNEKCTLTYFINNSE